ncbi:amino acid adenylation domain-containing protein [Streptomyces sp. NPDC088846]|uniref:non-ribosomal peptide synthetase n=1 Tax=Streptomyces sp. NPDC088846 TaxID=3365908 RepID=UPI0037F81645
MSAGEIEKSVAAGEAGKPATGGATGKPAAGGATGAEIAAGASGAAPASVLAAREELLRQRLAGRRSTPRTGIARADREAPLPLSFGQQQLWFLNSLDPESPEYLVPVLRRLRGPLDTDALTAAWGVLVGRHEILRTRYRLDNGEPVQVVDPPRAPGLPVVDLGALPASEREPRALALAGESAAQPFDLAAQWPARARLIRIADDDHLMVVVFHHIACDAWSIQVFERELGALYGAFTAGRPSPLPPLPVQYADFAAWQRGRVTGPALERRLDYWRGRLADSTPTELPTARPRPPVRDWRGAAVPLSVPVPLAAGLRELSRVHGVTLYTTLLAAFQALLSRYTGRDDITIGTVVSERTRPELQGLIGYGINSLVMHGSWRGEPSFTELLAGARDTVLGAFDHQETPFARLVDELSPARDTSRTPLFQIAFTLHEAPDGALDLPGIDVRVTELPWRTAKFDLALQVEETADQGLRGQLEFATSLFDPEWVETLAASFLRLLGALVDAPDSPVTRLPLHGGREIAVVAPFDLCPAGEARPMHEVFQGRAAENPTAVAVAAPGETLSYGELNTRANRIAHHLKALGVGPETLVGVCLGRGPELVPALLGVLKSGAAYVPLDPTHPVDRWAFVLGDTGAPVVVTTSEYVERLAGVYEGRLVVLDRDAEAIAAAPGSNPAPSRVGPDALAYVIYTSGSTGRPKGVCVSHAQVWRLLVVGDCHYGFSGDDVWPLFHSYAFDVSVWELWGALAHGGKLVVVPFDVARSPDDFLDLLVEHRVTVLNQTPSAFRSLVGAAGSGDPRIGELALRAVVFAGERLEFAELAPWVERLGLDRPRLLNMYGITETTVHSTYHRVTEQDLMSGGNPVGRPLADLRIHLLDRYGQVVPVGVTGEIHVGGPGVARGYLGRPALTAERFLPDPFGPAGSRLYRSGDLARRNADGTLDFLGRIDDQVKIRGYRIELGEIQAALAARPGVRDAAVVVRDDAGAGGRRLVAYLVPEAGSTLDGGALRAALGDRLPSYMVPAAFVVLDALPLTTNGKLDRRALPAPEQHGLHIGGQYLAPRNPLEELLVNAWSQVLGGDRIGVHDNFFELGGDSIRAVVLVGALRAAGLDVSVRDVFEFRTVAELAVSVGGRGAVECERPVEPFALVSRADRERVPAGVSDAYPMSQVQLGMLVEMLADEEQHSYHNITLFRIRDDRPFDAGALRVAAGLVTGRHEMLRTSFAVSGYEVPMQLVHESAEVPVEVRDLRGLAPEEQQEELAAYTASERAAVFDTTRAPMIRISAHVIDEGSWWFGLTECHSILEGWSFHSLLMEVLETYRTVRDGGQPAPVEPPAVRYADFIAAEQRALASAEDRAYWHDVVDRHATFALPAAWAGDRNEPRADYRVRVPLSDLDPELRALAAEVGVSLKSVLHAAHLKVMSMLTDEPAFFTGLVCNARPEAEGADRVYGMYLNSLPFGFERTAATWRELVRRTFDREVELWPHRRYPMPAIQREKGDGTRLLDVRFSYLDFHQVDTELVDFGASIDDSLTEFALATLAVGGHLVLMSHTHVMSRDHADRLAAMYRAVLEAMVADTDGDAQATYLPSGERELLLDDLSTTAPPVTVDAGVPGLFESWATRTPGATAVSYGDERLTYAETDERANRLAHHLRALGAGPESVVGVLLDRGPDLIVSLLAVWKAGAAYLPLDPGQPPARTGRMLAAAGVRLLVTQNVHAAQLTDAHPGRLVVLDRAEDRAAIGSRAATGTGLPADPDHLAYVIYTSGSTGVPKGVQVTHRGLANHVGWAAAELAGRGTGGAALFSSVAFDLVVPNLWAPLVTGQRVHILAQDFAVEDLGPLLSDAGPFSFLKLTPGHLEIIAHRLDDARATDLAAVIVVAGEAFPGRSADHWLRLLGPGRLINEYGPTEASVGSTVFPVDVPRMSAAETVPIGRALPGTTLYVLDSALRPVPLGVPGELYVGGTGVARGYAAQPGLTAERFVPDPYGPAGARLYRTGDLTRMTAGGVVEFLGRIDEQVKIRGYRVELGEIRTVLSEHAGVQESVVLAQPSAAGEARLVAYYVPVGGRAPGTEELAAHCAARLPAYMTPTAFLALDGLPLNRNGKVDRRALPAPDEAALGAGGRAYTAPRNPLEELLANAWSQVLGGDRIGVHDNFFELGGDSIRAVVLVGALRAAGLDVSVRDVFEFRTVAELAVSVGGRGAVECERPVEPFALVSRADRERVPAGVSDAYPMSQVQLGMLVEMLADEEQHSYHNITLFRIRDDRPFDAGALRVAAGLVTGRHEMLRTSFAVSGYEVPMQLVHESAEVPVEVRDLRGLAPEEQQKELAAYTASERAAVFDTTRAPLMRIGALPETDDTWRLTFTQCHAITEGWTFHTLVMDVLDAYRALRDGRNPAPVEPPAVRYADFIAAEQRALASAEDRAYWLDLVARFPKFTLPAHWADTSQPREDYGIHVPHRDLESGLRALASTAGVSLKSVLHAAHLKVMSMLTDEPAFRTGLVYSARPEAEGADRVYGMQLNSLPFPFERTAATWRELVRQTFDREVEQWRYRRYPMPAIQREAGDGRRLIDVLFTFQDFDQMDTDLIDTDAGEGDDSTEFALGVPTTPGYFTLRTHTHALSRHHADRLAGMYRAVLEAMVADADGDARMTYFPPGERELLLDSWNGAAVRLPAGDGCVHEVFETWAARTPEAIAVSYGDERLTYAEMNTRANRLAHQLRALGAGPESVVGVLLEPGIDLLPALLGVMKSGAAYLPLDPAQPAGRLDYMLSDAGQPLVVTRSTHAAAAAGARGLVLLDTDADALAARPDTDPAPLTVPDNALYLIYTSGSSGHPKGVSLTHRNLLRLYAATADRIDLDSAQVWALLHSYAFDVSVWEIWGALLHGGRVSVVPPAVARNPEELLTLLGEQGVTTLSLSPVAFRALIAAAGGDRARLDALALRTVVFGGDALEASDLAEWTAHQGLERTVLAQAYGPTETTVHVTFRRIGAADLAAGGSLPLGRAVDDTRVYVLDAEGRLAPAGVPGELYVSGAGVARGYTGRPALTAERFLPDPYGPPGARMYRTGDLARVRQDGDLEFLGRADEQLKIRGYRVEPGEIQAVLTDHRRIREAVVVARQSEQGDRRLVAYVVPGGGDGATHPSAAELAAHCSERLPAYMVPASFVPMAAIPLTVNGKLDHGALPAPDRSSAWSDREFVAPRTEVERRLTEIWSRVLDVEKVGIRDSFFDLGGDSISVLRVMAEVREAGLPVTLRTLYRAGTIEQLAASLDEPAAPRARAAQVPTGALAEAMDRYNVPGASLAVLRDGELVSLEAHGVVGAGSAERVTPDTPFKVASISKHITALGALTLAAQGVLDLDADINAYLTGWRVPERGQEGSPAAVVTVRQLLANVSGVAPEPDHEPYRPGDDVPAVVAALHGLPPARTPAVRFEHAPGQVFRKNRLNYLILEQVMVEVTGEPFADLMRALVFQPLGMARSSYDWSHHTRSRRPVALGHDTAGVPVPVGMPIHPCVAGGGLWTTAGDLARAAAEIRRAHRGLGADLLTRPLAQQMLTPHQDTLYGLSTVVDASGDDIEFGAFGEFDGYWAMSLTHVKDGDGLVVLTNGDAGREVGRAAIETHQKDAVSFGAPW